MSLGGDPLLPIENNHKQTMLKSEKKRYAPWPIEAIAFPMSAHRTPPEN
jgi:hypothetical protein